MSVAGRVSFVVCAFLVRVSIHSQFWNLSESWLEIGFNHARNTWSRIQ